MSMMNDERKPAWEQLIDWVDGRLSADEAEEIGRKMASASGELAEDIAWLLAFNQATGEVFLDEPPVELRTALRADFAEYAQKHLDQNEDGNSILQQLVAALTFDSGLQLSPAGLRSTDSGGQRQLIFSAEAADVILNLQRTGQSEVLVNGQILPFDDLPLDGFKVSLYRDSQSNNISIASTQTDMLGEFSFKALASEAYRLHLESDSISIAVGPVDIDPSEEA